MMALMIFSLGVVVIFKSFLISLDRMEYLTDRVYISTALDNRLEKIAQMLKVYKALPAQTQQFDKIDVGSRQITVEQTIDIKTVEDFVDVFSLDVTLKWNKKSKTMQLSRSAYITDFGEVGKK
ncbi:MAG: hypothetical protein HQL24_09105 [Candidatus Omnitrophica bacterium]|nr:hypothetical protein [Candidatus Omnitrophota bacterium]